MNRVYRKVADALAVYKDRRMLVIAGLGFSSGLPILLVYSTLTLWMTELEINLRTIGFASTVLFPYKLKFLWAPLVDRIKLGPFGLRRGWLLLTQLGLIITIIGIGFSDPSTDLTGCLGWAVALGMISATHDIVVDGYRVEILEPEEQGAGAAVTQLGYRIAMIVAGAGAVYAAHFWGWNVAYFIMAGFVVVGMIASVFATEPEGSAERVSRKDGESTGAFFKRSILEGAIAPFTDMLKRRGALLFICFIMLFTLGDALLSSATNSFLIKTGFTKLEIANVVKTFGTVATIAGVFVGGAMVNSLGLVKALWVAGLAQMLSNLTFSAQALVGHDVWLLTATIFVEKFSTGLAGAAFVGYLSALCSRSFGATHYAMLSAVSGLVKVAIGAFWGVAVTELILWSGGATGQSLLGSQFTPEAMGWALYFFATTMIAIPGLVLLYFLNKWNMTGLTGDGTSETRTAPG